MNYKLLYIGVLLVIFSCNKEVTIPNNGIYRGELAELDNNGDTVATGIFHLALKQEYSQFQMRGDTHTLAPPTHNGTYMLLGEEYMQFNFKGDYDTLHNPEHYLDTVFAYTFDDKNFELVRSDSARTYKYVMVRK